MRDDHDVVVDYEIGEDLQAIAVWEESSLLRLDLCLRYGHSIKAEHVDWSLAWDKK